MKWIVLSIVLGLGLYTYLTLHYRKTEPAFRPYVDIKDRANTRRLLSAGFQRIAVTAQLPADPTAFISLAPVSTTAGGLPEELRSTLVDQPLLPAEILRVAAAPLTDATAPYPVQFACALADNHRQLTGAELYVKESTVFIVPEFGLITEKDLLARSRESVVVVTIPPGALKPGRHDITLLGERGSKTWSVLVR